MRRIITRVYQVCLLWAFTWCGLQAQHFEFTFKGPDTLIANNNCEAVLLLDLDSLEVQSAIGANVTDTVLTILGQYSLGDTLPAGTVVTFNWTATDDQGNDSIFVFTITVVDRTAPNFSAVLPSDITVSCEAIPSPPVITIFDNCDPMPTLNYEQTSSAGSCSGEFELIRRWTASDNVGNQRVHEQVITVIDTQAPILMGIPADVTVLCHDVPDPPVIGVDITATDNCDLQPLITLNVAVMPGSCVDEYVEVRTWTAEDNCGNQTTAVQEITVIDTLPPVLGGVPVDVTVDCDDIPAPTPIGPGGVTASDNCTMDPVLSFSQSSSQHPDPAQCGHYNYTITRSWFATDQCGNLTSDTQIVSVADREAPTLYCLEQDTILTAPGTCLADGSLVKILFVSDNCTPAGSAVLTDTMDILNTSGTPLLSGKVDDIPFRLPFAGLPAQYITGNIQLSIGLIQADAEEPTEFYRVFGEDGTLIGQTNPTPSQCGSGETVFLNLTADQLNAWASDGMIDFLLVPNGDGVEAINQICPGGKVSISLSFDYEVTPPAGVSVSYRIDNGPEKDLITGTEQLSPGDYAVRLYATDCSGNRDSCDYALVILDRELPTLVCPPNQQVSTDLNTCTATFDLPFPVDAWDNCGFATTFEGSLPLQSLIFFTDPNAGVVPQDVLANFNAVPPSGPGNATLTVYIRGDIADPGEFFEVYGENNTFLGITGPGNPITECTLESAFSFTISESLISDWTSNGQVGFRLVSNKDVINYSDFVNPCGPVQPNGSDGISYVRFELAYSWIETVWQVHEQVSGDLVDEGVLVFPSQPNTTTLEIGLYDVTYTIEDRDGNRISCNYILEVADNVPPVVSCKPGLFIKTNPSGLVTVTVDETLLLATPATDNCGIAGFDIVPNTFTCSDAGSNFNVRVIAFDLSGNSDTCQTLVAIQNEELTPMFSLDTCAGNLRLIPDTTFTYPSPGTGDFFTFEWLHNGVFFSNQASPVIMSPQPSDAGTYVLTVTGLTGCTSTGTVQIDIGPNGAFRPNLIINSPVCQGDSIRLMTDWLEATEYEWKHLQSGTVFETDGPTLVIPGTQSNAGTWSVIVSEQPGCPSDESLTKEVVITPISVQVPDLLEACEGDMIALPAEGINAATYLWTGPGGNTWQGQNPVVPIAMGVYTVRVTSPEGCTATDSLTVELLQRPVVTALSNSCPDCVSGLEDCELSPSVFPPDMGGTYNYFWTNPAGDVFSMDSVALLTNITGAKSGLYTLVVEKNDNTCRSVPVSVFITLKDRPITPIISVDAPNPGSPYVICSGETLVLKVTNTSYTGNVRYIWHGPLGIDTTTVASLQIPAITINQGGTYTLEVLVNGCLSGMSNEQVIEVRPTPFAPTITTNSPVCAGDTLQLCAGFTAGASYEWVGPTGTFGPDFCLLFPNANTNQSGTYQVRMEVGGCVSAFAEPVSVLVRPNPEPKVITDDCNGEICLDVFPSCQLSVINPPGDLQYAWYDASTDTLVSNSGSDPFLFLNLPGNYQQGQYGFYLIVEREGCRSVPSVIHSVQMNTVPALIADAGPNQAVCEGAVVELCAEAPAIGTGRWTQSAGTPATIVNPNANCTTIQGYTPGETAIFTWSLSNGACRDYSTDNVELTISRYEEAQAPAVVEVCRQASVQLQATATQYGPGMWSQSPGQSGQGVTITDPNNPATLVQGLLPGNRYQFVWTVLNGACPESAAMVELNVYDDVAVAAGDRTDCGFGCLKVPLLADVPDLGTGRWYALNPGVTVEAIGEALAQACGLQHGPHVFVWELNNGVCGEASRDTVVIQYEFGPQAVDDIVQVPFAGQALVSVLNNDLVNSSVTTQIVGVPGEGSLTQVSAGVYRYVPPIRFAGTTEFRYRVCSAACPDVCSEARIVFQVEENTGCEVPTIITPNNDGVNDELVIPCLVNSNRFPNNRLSVFNEWGDEVFRASPYLNNWAGTYNGQPVPSGTYFFVFEPGGGEPSTSGFILIKY